MAQSHFISKFFILALLAACSSPVTKATAPTQSTRTLTSVPTATATLTSTPTPLPIATLTATPTEVPGILQGDGSRVVVDAQGMPQTIIVNGESRPATAVVMDEADQTVQYWDPYTESLQEMKYVKPSEVVVQDNNIYTGVVDTGWAKMPVAVYNAKTGVLARGDFLNDASEQIVYNAGVKIDGVWHLWQEGAWVPVEDDVTLTILDLGLDPNREYKEGFWQGKLYLFDQYNQARVAIKTEAGWQAMTEAEEKYAAYLKPLDGEVGETKTENNSTNSVTFTAVHTRYVDHYEGPWWSQALQKYIGVSVVEVIIQRQTGDWESFKAQWKTSLDGHQSFHDREKKSGYIAIGPIAGTLTENWRRVRIGLEVYNNVVTKYESRSDVDGLKVQTELQNVFRENNALLLAKLNSHEALPEGLIVRSWTILIPFDY